MKGGWCGLVLTLLALTVACGDAGRSGVTPTAAGTTASAPTTEAAAAKVRAYFVRDEKVAVAGRTVTTPAVARGAVEALLDGPDSFETGIGMTSQIPPGTKLLGLDIHGGVATVDLSAEFASGGGSLSMGLRVAQVVFTLTQFDTVDTVSILLEGRVPTEGIGGEGVPATALDRRDVADLTPLVLVESPVPGELVSSPLMIEGIANTFEATVNYTLTSADGSIIAKGFTTATAGSGEWGDFSVTFALANVRADEGTLVAFQQDAQTGAPRDVYEVPVRLH